MARILPFRGLHFAPVPGQELGARWLEPLSPLAEAERRALAQTAHHAVHVRTAHHPEELLHAWHVEGALVRDDKPSLYVVSVEGRDGGGTSVARYLLGLLAPAPALLELEEGRVGPLRPPTHPVPALVPDDHQVLLGLLSEVVGRGAPLWEAHFDGRAVRLWRLNGSPTGRRLQSALADVPVRPLMPLAKSGPTLVAVAPLSERGLHLRPVHRAIRSVGTFAPERFLTLVREYARVYELDAPLDTPEGLAQARERLAVLAAGYHAVLLVLPGGRGRILRFRQGLDLAHVPAAPRSPTLRSLDLALLNALVLKTVLGVQSPEQEGHPQVFTVPTLEALVEGVEAGHYQAGFGLNPPPVWEVRAVMEAEQRLPARTLHLDPLPPEGVVFFNPED